MNLFSQQQTAVVMVENPNQTVIIHTQQSYPAQTVPPPAAQQGPPPQYSQDTYPPGQYPMAEDPIPPKTDQ